MKQRRFLSVLLALCLVLGMCPGTVFAAGGRLPFTDVKTADWYYDAVQYVYVEGMMNGTGAATFSPNSTTSRGMIVTILHRLDGTPSATGAAFTDVPAGQWYTDAVAWASANEIVGGYGDGKFGPDDPITREQMAAILYRYSQYKGYDTTVSGSLSGFPDVAKTSSYAADAMGWAVGTGLIAGMDDGTLAPQGNATRAQAATIFMRFSESLTKGDDLQDGITEAEGQQMVDLVDAIDKMTDSGADAKDIKEYLENISWIESVTDTPDGGLTCKTTFGVTGVWSLPSKDYLSYSMSNNYDDIINISSTVSLAEYSSQNGPKIVILIPYYSDDSNFNVNGYTYLANCVAEATNGTVTILRDEEVSLEQLKNLDEYDIVFFYSHGALSDISNSAWDILPSDPYTMTGEVMDSPLSYVFLSDDFFSGRTVVNLEDGRIGIGGDFYREYYSDNQLSGMIFHFGSCSSMRNDTLADGILSRGAEWVEGWTNSVSFVNDFHQLTNVVAYLCGGYTISESVRIAPTTDFSAPYIQSNCSLVGKGNGNYCLPLIEEIHGTTITGNVIVSETEMPIEGVNVYLNCIFDDGKVGIGAACVTAADGTFKLTIPENATYVVGIQFEKDGYSSYLFPLAANGNTSFHIGTVSLTPIVVDPIITPTISGIVKDADTDKPIEGVTVYLMCIFGAGGEDLAARCETAADGTFTMDIPQSESITGVSSIEFQKDGYNSYRLSLDSSTNFSLGTIKLVPIDSSIDSSLYTFEIEENIDKRTFTTTSSGSQAVALTYQISTDIPDFDASNVQWTTTSTVTDLQTDGQNAVVTTNTGFTITASYTYNGYTYTCDHQVSSLVIRALLGSVQW